MEQPPTLKASTHSLVALVTGGSRGVGAETARLLAGEGIRVVVNYRQKKRRANQVVAQIAAAGGFGIARRADLTNPDELGAMFTALREQFGRLDILVLNASGGMERSAGAGYALRLNRDAQVSVLDHALELMSDGGRVVFVTSHQAHFHGQRPAPPAYEPVARSKRAGEDALRARIPELAARGVRLVVVSGDTIDGTATAVLLDHVNPGVLDARRRQVGGLPTVGDLAGAVARATRSTAESGNTVYVGGHDFLVGPAPQAAAITQESGRDHWFRYSGLVPRDTQSRSTPRTDPGSSVFRR